jgi:predicted AlkP superfamily pyrophosphatase or phosphodiesterase
MAFDLDPAFVRPTYDARSFTAVPASVVGLLGRGPVSLASEALAGLPQRHRKVVVILADGFGWRFFERFADGYGALRRFCDHGTATKFTSQFPSTTAAHITCLHTGLEVGQSGVYEWQYYEPQLDAIIIPLLFSFAGTKDREQLRAAGVDPARILPEQTLYQKLAQAGIASTVYQHKEYTPSTYSDYLFRGATTAGYHTLPEALINLRTALIRSVGPAYFVLYFDRIDALAHGYGPASPQVEAEIDAFLVTLERLFLSQIGGGDTLVLLTADHGEVEIDPAGTIYLNTDPAFRGIERFLRTDRRGRPLVPAGAARDFFLYVAEEMLDEAQDFLARGLAGRAAVYRTADLIAAGFFGAQPPVEPFLSRAGNLVILPYRGESVWWYERGRFEQSFYGHHGGLTREEMEIPVLGYAA